jgi:hypothetical protein
MVLTDHASLYAAVSESGINRVAQLLMRQRPSYFNYATQGLVARQDLLCQAIDVDPEVTRSGNPLVTIEQPLPILGTNGRYGLDFCFQLRIAQVDFAPGNVVGLPPPLTPLPAQRLAVHVGVVGGVACPPAEVIAELPPVADPTFDLGNLNVQQVVPLSALNCFSLDAFVVMGTRVLGQPPSETLSVQVTGFELVDVQPAGVESIIECYVNLVTQVAVLPRLRAMAPTAFHLPLPRLSPDVVLPLAFDATFTPASPAVPNNPAFEEDQLKLYVDATVSA